MQTMTNTAPTLIPLNQLHRSELNVRKTGGTDVAELAANILAVQRVAQNLIVVPESRGKKTGYGVVAGGRRLAALLSLAKAKSIPADWPIPCQVVTTDEAQELSLSENVHRERMHPADEFTAWAELVDAGRSVDDIAARHGVTAGVVRRRLLLARVSPLAMQLFRDDELDLAQLEALTLTDDHAAQDALLTAGYYPRPYDIRRALTGGAVRGSDPRARYIGVDAYVAAGGSVRSDMFSNDEDVYFEDAPLLIRLVSEKLEKTAAKLRKNVAWVHVHAGELDYAIRGDYAQVPTIRKEPDADTTEQLVDLHDQLRSINVKRDALQAEDPDDSDDSEQAWEQWQVRWAEVDSAGDAIEDQIRTIEQSLQIPHPDAAELVGVALGLTGNGKICKYAGVIRAADKAKLRAPVGTNDGDTAETEASIDKADPQSVRTDLSTFLTAVAQEALAENVHVGLRALAYQLALPWIGERYANHGVSIAADDHARLYDSPTLEGSEIEQQRQQRHEAWQGTLPADAAALWQWCLDADDHTIQSLLAYSVARSLTGVQAHAGSQRISPLLAALNVDLTTHWQPRADYFNRIKKNITLAVLADHGYTDPALQKLKRSPLAEQAAHLLEGSGWLPPTLTM